MINLAKLKPRRDQNQFVTRSYNIWGSNATSSAIEAIN